MKSEKYCKNVVKKSGSNFYYSFLFLSKRRRRAIYAFYAFSRIIDDIVDEEMSIETKERLIGFWRNEIDKCYSTKDSKHPLSKELCYLINSFDIPRDYFLELILGVAQDMVQKRYASFNDLEKYCFRVASIVGLVCLKIFEVYESEDNKSAAVNLGFAFQMTNIIRDVGVDAEMDRIYMPKEDMLSFGVTEEDILQKKYNDNFIKLMEFEARRTEAFYQRAMTKFENKAKKKLLPAIIMADIYHKVLLKIRRKNYAVFSEKISISNVEKFFIAFKRWVFG